LPVTPFAGGNTTVQKLVKDLGDLKAYEDLNLQEYLPSDRLVYKYCR
jgi:hypothetical protein